MVPLAAAAAGPSGGWRAFVEALPWQGDRVAETPIPVGRGIAFQVGTPDQRSAEGVGVGDRPDVAPDPARADLLRLVR